jgi:hypothetical protein
VATIEFEPNGSLKYDSTATFPVRAGAPRMVFPRVNLTEPVGLGPFELTVAVSVTVWPKIELLKSDDRAVLVEYLFTVCITVAELEANVPSVA